MRLFLCLLGACLVSKLSRMSTFLWMLAADNTTRLRLRGRGETFGHLRLSLRHLLGYLLTLELICELESDILAETVHLISVSHPETHIVLKNDFHFRFLSSSHRALGIIETA